MLRTTTKLDPAQPSTQTEAVGAGHPVRGPGVL